MVGLYTACSTGRMASWYCGSIYRVFDRPYGELIPWVYIPHVRQAVWRADIVGLYTACSTGRMAGWYRGSVYRYGPKAGPVRMFDLHVRPQLCINVLCNAFKVQWSLYVPPGLTFNNSTFCPHTVFVCSVWISEQTAII